MTFDWQSDVLVSHMDGEVAYIFATFLLLGQKVDTASGYLSNCHFGRKCVTNITLAQQKRAEPVSIACSLFLDLNRIWSQESIFFNIIWMLRSIGVRLGLIIYQSMLCINCIDVPAMLPKNEENAFLPLAKKGWDKTHCHSLCWICNPNFDQIVSSFIFKKHFVICRVDSKQLYFWDFLPHLPQRHVALVHWIVEVKATIATLGSWAFSCNIVRYFSLHSFTIHRSYRAWILF